MSYVCTVTKCKNGKVCTSVYVFPNWAMLKNSVPKCVLLDEYMCKKLGSVGIMPLERNEQRIQVDYCPESE